MAEDSEQGAQDEREGEHREFYRSLSTEEKLLITLRDELYSGSWESMLADLRARLEGKPYIFRLATRIEEDIARIDRLRRYEAESGVNLGQLGAEEK